MTQLKRLLDTQTLPHLTSLIATLVLILACYWLYSWKVLLPHNFGYFSLIDDGQTITNSLSLKQCVINHDCASAGSVIFETQFGRFRPVYWVIQALIHFGFSFDANALHLFRVYGLGTLLVILLNLCIYSPKSSWTGHVLASALFFTSFSFTENLLRLGPGEPYQLVFLGLFSLLYLHSNTLRKLLPRGTYSMSLVAVLLMMALIKETTLAVIPVLVLMKLQSKTKFKVSRSDLILSLTTLIVIGTGLWLSRPQTSAENYVVNYSLKIFQVLKNTQIYSTLIYAITFPVLPIMMAVVGLSLTHLINFPLSRTTQYWLYTFICFTLILFPWGVILERYLLISLFCFYVIFGRLWSQAMEWLWGYVKKIPTPSWLTVNGSVLVSAWALSNLFFFVFPFALAKTLNYVSWYSQFLAFQHREVEMISQTPQPLYLNAADTLENWEVLFELPIHLSFFYHQTRDLPLLPSDPSLIPKPGYLYTSSSFHPVIPQNYTYEKDFLPVSYQSLEIPQIDTLAFVEGFRLRPIATISKPPLTNNPLTQWWGLWERR